MRVMLGIVVSLRLFASLCGANEVRASVILQRELFELGVFGNSNVKFFNFFSICQKKLVLLQFQNYC